MMDFKDILEYCHQRHNKPLNQRKGLATHCLFNKNYTHQFTVYCAHKYPVMLSDLEQAHISFVPIGLASKHDRHHRTFSEEQRFLRPESFMNRGLRHWKSSLGIQIYTGIFSEHNGARWHDLEFTYQALCAEPEAVMACIEALTNAVVNPLLTITESGGLRFSCRVPDYLHPNTKEARLYICGGASTVDEPNHQEVYLVIFGENGLSCWDARYEILTGDLLNPPIIRKDVLFAHVDTLRTLIHKPIPPSEHQLRPNIPSATTELPTLASHNLDLANAAFVKRGFSYIRKEDAFHYWAKFNNNTPNIYVSLWECDDTVWIWPFKWVDVPASVEDTELPVEPTPITDVWKDTGIQPSTPKSILPISDKVWAVREGQLSPLGLKRSAPILSEQTYTTNTYETYEKNIDFIRKIIDRTTRITGLITDTSAGTNSGIESYLRDSGTICLNIPNIEVAEEALQHFEKHNLPAVALWKPRNYKWNQVKDIPIEMRMANPFQGGNVCEDPKRCNELQIKGGDPRVSICPQCPVHTECQQRGYLSQYNTLKQVMAQIVYTPKLFFNPIYAGLLDDILEKSDNTDRLCIMYENELHSMFIECIIPKELLEEWNEQWHGYVLGNFARALLNILETRDVNGYSIVQRIRATVNLFQQQKKELVEQMCQVNVQGKVIEHGIVDKETGEELARHTIQFESGKFAYIPLNEKAANRLREKGLPSFHLRYFLLNEDVKIPMQMTQAIELGVFDISTLEKIRALPTVYQDPNWTIWHQLQRYFEHYKRDVDAPIGLSNDTLLFWIPPVLHPKVERLLIMSSGLFQRHYHNIFPTEKAEVLQVKPTTWQTGNQVFQIRTGNYPLHSLVDYDDNWNKSWLSKTALRFLLGILGEIERTPNIKHVIITYNTFAKWILEFVNNENTYCITHFKNIDQFDTDLAEAQVVWLIGTPYWAPGVLWLRSQMLFGNDEKPISYEVDSETGIFKDERVQNESNQHIISLFTNVIGRARLNSLTGKKIVLITSVKLPDITDRPETILFDWEDFEVAGGLDKLPETVATRQRFEKERENITAEYSRAEVERILGCSTRQANRVLQRLRGGIPLRVPLQEQILSALSTGDKTTAELVECVEGHPVSIKQEMRRLVDTNEIVKVRRGMYALPEPKQ